jgi:VIT1/CCC1 family predicted Fe2+/Mn2+ transporter
MLDAVRRSARRYSNTCGLIDSRVLTGLTVTIGAIMILLTFLLVSCLWYPLWLNLTTLSVFWEISTILGIAYGSHIHHN